MQPALLFEHDPLQRVSGPSLAGKLPKPIIAPWLLISWLTATKIYIFVPHCLLFGSAAGDRGVVRLAVGAVGKSLVKHFHYHSGIDLAGTDLAGTELDLRKFSPASRKLPVSRRKFPGVFRATFRMCSGASCMRPPGTLSKPPGASQRGAFVVEFGSLREHPRMLPENIRDDYFEDAWRSERYLVWVAMLLLLPGLSTLSLLLLPLCLPLCLPLSLPLPSSLSAASANLMAPTKNKDTVLQPWHRAVSHNGLVGHRRKKSSSKLVDLFWHLFYVSPSMPQTFDLWTPSDAKTCLWC